MTPDETLDAIEDAYRAVNRAHAVLARCLAELVVSTDFAEYPYLGDEVGALLSISSRKASTLINHAENLASRPAVLAALEEGRIDQGKALLIVDQLEPLTAVQAEIVEAVLIEYARTHHYSRIRQHAQRLIAKLDPEAAARRHEEKKRTRQVEKLNLDDAMCALRFQFTAVQGALVWDRIDRIAQGLGEDERTMDQRRADVAFDLLMGKETGAPQGEVKVLVTLPATTLMGMDQEPGMLAGYGPIPADVARDIAAGGTWKRILTDPVTGVAVDVGRTNYRPSAALADLVRARDVTCVAIGCRQPAHRCDLDHCEPFDGTNTIADDLGAKCRRHHAMKHHTRWKRTQLPGGIHIWTTPMGRTYVREPEPIADPTPPF
ncbi:HNH endonuclease signature motif containing protein [Allokutzneria oryzae]|uniref:DUF222 domain-containing protein n=1 Tax=Allokutzneria oryzae TaxID=1378989 RepID=A0ABV6A3E8_9PSEU